ncbi:GNAT family N-acetyltransferase [Actinoplanes sp. NPDC051859]|uniref:GNAT family N-acetyltransferase n=1 Tax=Actinoplanes sp. NPDC051859 TaxID=3363909 RepID=UPI0037AF6ADB
MPDLERLTSRHAAELFRFEQENRAYFARSVPDRGDDYFTNFAQRHAALLAEQDAGSCHFHVMVDDDGAVVGRFNLVDVADGSAELGFRVAERMNGRGLAKDGVRQVCELARDKYQLRRLSASASPGNTASLAVLGASGFFIVGEDRVGIRQCRDLA